MKYLTKEEIEGKLKGFTITKKIKKYNEKTGEPIYDRIIDGYIVFLRQGEGYRNLGTGGYDDNLNVLDTRKIVDIVKTEKDAENLAEKHTNNLQSEYKEWRQKSNRLEAEELREKFLCSEECADFIRIKKNEIMNKEENLFDGILDILGALRRDITK